ncbi:MAG: hypothetical protein WC635_12765 [Bacteriovorax sp.]
MDLMRLVFPVFFLLTLAFSPVNAKAEAVRLKTLNVTFPTDFGIFLGEIHYNESDFVQAQKVERIIREDLIKVIRYFEYVPRDVVHFNIDPYMRLTNGSARTFPTNIINLYNFPANNQDHLIVMENWMQGLMVHEFIHVTHLDQTRDYLEVGRKIFGTIAKVPAAIVPRWFTEGIAVWGESHLINGGRLNNPLFNKELLIQFKKQDFCKTIDCLDDPGTYPNGELAYWAGAHFMEYLENLKGGTIKCLVEANSQNLPFLLNNPFSKCTGEKAQDLFDKFREFYTNNEAPVSAELESMGEKVSNAFGVDDYQKGQVLDGDRLFKVEHEKKREALVAYDLKDPINYSAQYDLPIVDVAAMVDIDNENRFLLVSFNDDPNFRTHNKIWKLINPDTLLVERTLNFSPDPSYVVSLGGDNFLAFSYWENKWIVERNEKRLRTFSSNVNISLVKKIGDRLLLKINDSDKTSSLVLADLNLEKLQVIYKSSAPYDLPFTSEKFVVIREGHSLKLLEFDGSTSINARLSDLPADLLNRITFATFNQDRVLVLENRLKTLVMPANVFDAKITGGKSKTQTVAVTEFQMPDVPVDEALAQKAENYPRLDHFIPHYWFLAVGSSENLNSIGAMTTFVDPMETHFMNATGLIYPEINRGGGSLDYVHKMTGVSDQWKVRAFASQEYSRTDFSDQNNLDRDISLRTYYSFLKRRWTYTPGIYGGYAKTNDFISNRSVKNMGISQTLTFQAMTFDDFFQFLTIGLNLQTNRANLGGNYFVTQLNAEGGSRFTEKLTASLKGSYGKLYKNDFSRGVIYGGGISDYANQRLHEFYGLPYSNAYGNEIFTARFTVDYNFWDIYRGKNMIPFYFKEAHLLLGRESLYADRIILDGFTLRERMINALFVGPRIKMNWFYHVPTNIDLIFSTITNPNGDNVNKIDFTIMADLF